MTAAALLAERVLGGDARAVARAISLIEDEDPSGADVVRAIFAGTGAAYLIGVTGPPGAGKSTLVDRLAAEFRRSRRARLGIIAVDPTSPFTGGAVLGDRLRMQSHATDDDVFIRSMATRGHLGGLARATGDAALVLDAAGKDIIIIETVGVGQDEVEVVRTADISIVVLVPGTGDDVQALKAGIMEIADIFVVNKADREGADRLISAVEANLALHAYGAAEWRPPIIKTVATTGEGVAQLVETIEAFRKHNGGIEDAKGAKDAEHRPQGSPKSRRLARAEHRLRELVSRGLMEQLERTVLRPGELAALAARIEARDIDPYSAAAEVVARRGKSEA